MANCPKCNAHLRLVDWKQHCPHCGANIVIYDLQERLMRDADIAEVQNYHFQKKIDRLKASFVGSKLAVVRIITTILPIVALVLPLVNAKFSAPFGDFEGKASVITIYSNINGITDALGEAFSGVLLPFGIAFVLLLLSIILIVLKLILLTLSCSPKGKQRNITLNILQLATSIGSAISFICIPQNSSVSGKLAIGTLAYIALLVLSAVIDILCLKQGIEVKHKQCYVGAIPIEEYFKMIEDGVPLEQIRQEQYDRLQAIQDEKEAKLLADEKAKEEKHKKN